MNRSGDPVHGCRSTLLEGTAWSAACEPEGRIELPTYSLRVKSDPTQCHPDVLPGHEPTGHDAVQPNESLSPQQRRRTGLGWPIVSDAGHPTPWGTHNELLAATLRLHDPDLGHEVPQPGPESPKA